MNRAYFINHSESKPILLGSDHGSWLLAANVQLPILWLALFEEHNIQSVQVPFSNEEGQEDVQDVPTLFAETQEARERYESRKEHLAAVINPQFEPYIVEWDTFLATCIPQPFVQIEFTELWMMEQPEYFMEDVRNYLHAVAEPRAPEWAGLSAQACLSDPDVALYGLRGFPCEAELDWE
jgi:hypothetical protein